MVTGICSVGHALIVRAFLFGLNFHQEIQQKLTVRAAVLLPFLLSNKHQNGATPCEVTLRAGGNAACPPGAPLSSASG